MIPISELQSNYGINNGMGIYESPHRVYPVTEETIGNLLILYRQCENSSNNINGSVIAHVPVIFWFDDFIDRFYKKISFVTEVNSIMLHGYGSITMMNMPFSSFDEFENYLNYNPGLLILRGVTKSLDITQPQYGYKYLINFGIATSTQLVRDYRIDQIVKDDGLPF